MPLNDREHKGVDPNALVRLIKELGVGALVISQPVPGTDRVVHYAYSISNAGNPNWTAIHLL